LTIDNQTSLTMKKALHKAVAIVGMGAVMPDAQDSTTFWNNIKQGKYSISEVPDGRWDIHKYYDPDRKAPDKTYSKIGGWVKEDGWNPLKWRMPIPPKVSDQMDYTQKWAITAAREALLDFGYPDKDFDKDRTAVILGVAMGGDQHLYSAARIFFPEYAEMLTDAEGFAALPADTRKKILGEMYQNLDKFYPGITEDTMPGELSNIVAGRIAALYNFHGPNYIADAACASAMAGISAAIEGLEEYDFDLVVTGGIDANMSPTTFVKFCKIGALSATGTRPYAEGADGFVMGEGGAVFVLKRLDDAERDGDKIYAVIRSLGGSSDGKGKGITAPNPIGQKLAVKRGWENAGLSPASATLIEGHGTSTSVGDAAELQCLDEVFGEFDLPVGSIALGSVKSNIGHLKGAAGAAGIFKAAMALHERVLPPSLNFHKPNPGVDFNTSPFAVNTQLRPWEMKNGNPRRAGVSAFGFGGTNFHAVLEEYIPGKITSEQKTTISMAETSPETRSSQDLKTPLRGAFVKGAGSLNELVSKLEAFLPKVEGGWSPEKKAPAKADLQAAFRLAIDYGDASELAEKITRAIKGIKAGKPGVWKPLNAKGIFLGQGPAPKIAFTFTGQGSQYVNMLRELKETEPIIADTFREADEVMTPLLGKPLTEFIFIDETDKEAVKEAAEKLMQTEITQPAVLTIDVALCRLMGAYGVAPDFVIGHSLGEYGALVASGAITFANALKAVSARGTQMAQVQVEDKGIMAAVFGSPEAIMEIISKIDGYVEIANINSYGQSVIGGATEPVKQAMAACKEAGFHVAQLAVSHAFHTQIVAPASKPLGEVLGKFGLKSPEIPVIANVTGDFYPSGPGVEPQMIDILSKQVASPVQFVKGINKLYDSGARVFIEMGPKKALNGFVRDIMSKKDDVMNLFTNHPKVGDITSFNHGLCGAYASGLGYGESEAIKPVKQETPPVKASASSNMSAATIPVAASPVTPPVPVSGAVGQDRYEKLGRLFVDFMDKANSVYSGGESIRPAQDIWITGASVGLPGIDGVFKDTNVQSLLRGDQFITSIPEEFQQEMLDKNITRLVKTGKGGPRFETISQVDEVIKLAARKINLDIVRDFGFPPARKAAIDTMTELAIGAGIDALRDAGIPLVMHYKDTTTGSKLPDRWLLPDSMKDDTGIIFVSAFPGYNAYAKEMGDFYKFKALEEKLALLKHIRGSMTTQNGNTGLTAELDQRISAVQQEIDAKPYNFNRRFLLRVLAMGHSQFAEYIGARGPNTQINSACASTTMAVGLSKDWIEAGRCKRVIIIAGDDITSDDTIAWFSSGFLAVGAAATDEKVEDAALPFDKRRHGMIVGMGGAAIIVESGDSARERGINPICEVLGTTFGNSAFHGTRLDVDHIRMVMEDMVAKAERKWGIDRHQIASEMVFISHETYTPARGGSASAEINALRYVFNDAADNIVIANTKGMTGHAMAVGIEDVLAIKSLETGLVPPVPNFKVVDPELGELNLSKGGNYPIRYALRLGAGFGSQISMSLLRWTPVADGQRRSPDQLGYTYRIADQQRFDEWLQKIGNKTNPEMEVFKRTLRIKDPMADKLTEVEEATQVPQKPVDTVQTPVTPPVEVVAAVTPEPEGNPVKVKILNLIAEKTGYPVDMLNPELDLEADLGIDTVKQAELFADIRGEYGIERDDNYSAIRIPDLESHYSICI
jgi:malonyl CoA-acyl carrier protein transacylase